MKKAFFCLFIFASATLFLGIGVMQAPVGWFLGGLGLPRQLAVEQPFGNLYAGDATLTIEEGMLKMQSKVNWSWCPLEAGVKLTRWCIDLTSEGLQAKTLLSWSPLIGPVDLSFSEAEIRLQNFALPHQIGKILVLNGNISLDYLNLDVHRSGLHLISELMLRSPDLALTMLNLDIDKGALELVKKATSELTGSFEGTAFRASGECFEDGRYEAQLILLSDTAKKQLKLFLGDKEQYNYSGRWL